MNHMITTKLIKVLRKALANRCRHVISNYHEEIVWLLIVVIRFILPRFLNTTNMRIYQKDIKNEQDFYREVTRQIQEIKGLIIHHHEINQISKNCKCRLFRLLRKIRNYENSILETCLHFLRSRRCFGEKKKQLLEAFKIYLIFLWEFESYFNFLDRKNFILEKIEILFLELYIKKRNINFI